MYTAEISFYNTIFMNNFQYRVDMYSAKHYLGWKRPCYVVIMFLYVVPKHYHCRCHAHSLTSWRRQRKTFCLQNEYPGTENCKVR
jgi:hypothetical protein